MPELCEHVLAKGSRRGQPCGRRAPPAAEGAARCLCKAHEPFPLGALPVLVLHQIASYVKNVDVMLALPRVSRSLRAATSSPVLWDRFHAQVLDSQMSRAAVQFGLTARQKLRLVSSRGPWTCEACSAAFHAFPQNIPCFLCSKCASDIFVARQVLTESFAVGPDVLDGLRRSSVFLRADVQRALGGVTLEQHAAAVTADKRARVSASALANISRGPMQEALHRLCVDVGSLVSKSAHFRAIHVNTDVELCVVKVVRDVVSARIDAAIAVVFEGAPNFCRNDSPTLALAIEQASSSGCVDAIACIDRRKVASEVARTRNTRVLRARVAMVLEKTGVSSPCCKVLVASDDDEILARADGDRRILRIIGDRLMHAPGKHAGHEDARHRLWQAIEDVYVDRSDLLQERIAAGDLDGILDWFESRNARAEALVVEDVVGTHQTKEDVQACPLCRWKSRNKPVWKHMETAHQIRR